MQRGMTASVALNELPKSLAIQTQAWGIIVNAGVQLQSRRLLLYGSHAECISLSSLSRADVDHAALRPRLVIV